MTARVAIAAVGVVAAFVVLLVGAEAVPDGPIVRRLAAAVDDGGYGPVLAPDAVGGLHDGFTECVALGQGLGSPPEPLGLFRRTLWAPRLGACEEGAEQLATLAGGGEVTAGPYYRYWNGYAPLTRIVVALVGVPGLRVVVALLLLAAGASAGLALVRRLGWPTTAALAAPLLVASNAVTTPAGSFTHAISLAAVAIGTGVVAVATSRAGWRGAAAGAAAAAALFVYVDLLTTPALAWAVTTFVAAAVPAAESARPRTVAVTGLTAGVAWPVAYAATWAARWLLAAAALGGHVLDAVVEIGRFRVGGAYAGVSDQLGAATRTNLAWWWDRTPTAPVVLGLAAATCVAALAVARRHGGPDRADLARVAMLAAPTLLVPAWYELLSNHSQIHAFFTYRSIPGAIGIGTAACVLVAVRRRAAAPEP